MKNTNNTYLKHQLRILAEHEGVTVEARDKAYKYVANYIEKMLAEINGYIETIDHLVADLKEAENTIEAQAKQCGELKKENKKLRENEQPQKSEEKPVKKKTAARKTKKA